MIRQTISVGPLDINAPSPQHQHDLILKYRGEVPFGPPYYNLWIRVNDDYVGPGEAEIFGDKAFWSPDERYVVLEAWHSLETPDNGLVVLDLRTTQHCQVDDLGSKFLRDVVWHQGKDGWKITYQTDQYQDGHSGSVVQMVTDVRIGGSLDWTFVNWLLMA